MPVKRNPTRKATTLQIIRELNDYCFSIRCIARSIAAYSFTNANKQELDNSAASLWQNAKMINESLTRLTEHLIGVELELNADNMNCCDPCDLWGDIILNGKTKT
ncbi:MAG: hypothetical protein LBP59_10760 [Planctomycetaceae bacterium]|jgi:hypothetical protein|nr:hypothetical protein [Planctomycetaceae bacterium]